MLPCTSLERFFIDDQAAGSDVMCHAVFEVGRLFDTLVISEGFDRALQRHPMLTAKIVWNNDGKPCWVPSNAHFLTFDVTSFVGDLGSAAQINLENSSGLRALVQYVDGRMRIQMRFHHAVCDGLAIAYFFKDWMSGCRALAEGRQADYSDVNASLLSSRGLSRWRSPVKIGRVSASLSLMRRFFRWIAVRPSRIESNVSPDETYSAEAPQKIQTNAIIEQFDCVDILNRIDCECDLLLLSCNQTSRIKEKASTAGITINTFITSVVFVALRDFLDVKQSDGKSVPLLLRLSIPNSLRTRHDKQMPACNILGIAFIDQLIKVDPDPTDLAHSISLETSEIRRWGGGQAFLDGLAMVQSCGPLYRRILRSDLCFASAIFSSLGDVSWIDPDLLLFCGKPPLRRNTNVAVFASIVGGQLAITVNVSRASLRADDLAILISKIRSRLEAVE